GTAFGSVRTRAEGADPVGRGGPLANARLAAPRGHGVPRRRRRERHDGIVYPIELHGVRVGTCGTRHWRFPAEQRGGIHPPGGTSDRRRGREAPVPHHYPRVLEPGWRGAVRVWRDGRNGCSPPSTAFGCPSWRVNPAPLF